MDSCLLRLRCGTNNYAWGKVGLNSAVARFAAATPHDGCRIDGETPYSELWMGSHPSNPSYDVATGRSLQEIIQNDPHVLGAAVEKRFGKLPFLFKVLSVRNALSIQAHPNKALAASLHKLNPAEYKDNNHKPEMTIAITHFEGLSGFRPLADVAYLLGNVYALRSLVGEKVADQLERTSWKGSASQAKQKTALKWVFTALVRASPEDVRLASQHLLKQISGEGQNFAGGIQAPAPGGKALGELIVRLNSQFPADIGLFMTLLMNFVALRPGEAMFLKADEVHAYISGDIIECMAESDNVVRAGFTPKYKDADTLCQMLTYNFAPASEQKMHTTSYNSCTFNEAAMMSGSSCVLYDPPIEEFSVLKTWLGRSGASVSFDPFHGATIVICTQGEGIIKTGAREEQIKAGWVYFVGAESAFVLQNTCCIELETYQAFCEPEDA